jgi:hypothetical protein
MRKRCIRWDVTLFDKRFLTNALPLALGGNRVGPVAGDRELADPDDEIACGGRRKGCAARGGRGRC